MDTIANKSAAEMNTPVEFKALRLSMLEAKHTVLTDALATPNTLPEQRRINLTAQQEKIAARIVGLKEKLARGPSKGGKAKGKGKGQGKGKRAGVLKEDAAAVEGDSELCDISAAPPTAESKAQCVAMSEANLKVLETRYKEVSDALLTADTHRANLSARQSAITGRIARIKDVRALSAGGGSGPEIGSENQDEGAVSTYGPNMP